MADKILWESDLSKGLARARSEGKPVLLDFFDPNCIGCQQMGAVTYPDSKDVEFINASLVPIRLPSDAQPYAADYKVKWTPNLIVLDQDGKEHHRSMGFLSPEELIPFLMLGMAKVYFDHDDFANALVLLEKVLEEYPKREAAPEALYLRGVTLYKTTGDAWKLKQAYDELASCYPESEWLKKASPYAFL